MRCRREGRGGEKEEEERRKRGRGGGEKKKKRRKDTPYVSHRVYMVDSYATAHATTHPRQE
jgi:hypothetical protein